MIMTPDLRKPEQELPLWYLAGYVLALFPLQRGRLRCVDLLADLREGGMVRHYPSHYFLTQTGHMDRNATVITLCLSIVLVLAGCSGSSKTQTPSEPTSSPVTPPESVPEKGPSSPAVMEQPPPDAVTRLIQDALRSDGSVSYRELIDRLGDPRSVSSEPVPNTYDPKVVDTLRTMAWVGVEALVYDVAGESRSFLIRFSVLSAQYETPEGLRVGDSQSRILDLIGEPTDRDRRSGDWVYQENDATPTAMILSVKRGTIERIDWEFYFS